MALEKAAECRADRLPTRLAPCCRCRPPAVAIFLPACLKLWFDLAGSPQLPQMNMLGKQYHLPASSVPNSPCPLTLVNQSNLFT